MQLSKSLSPVTPSLRIDPDALLMRVPELTEVMSGGRTWEEFGEITLSKSGKLDQCIFRVVNENLEFVSPDARLQWGIAKKLVYSVLPAADRPRGAIPNRFSNLGKASTLVILGDISLWLAGEMQIPVKITRPMVAAMLFGIHKSAGNPAVLNDGEVEFESTGQTGRWIITEAGKAPELHEPEQPGSDIPGNFHKLDNASASALLSDLSVWLAEELEVSASITRPQVAAMLFGIRVAAGKHEFSGQPESPGKARLPGRLEPSGTPEFLRVV